MNQTHRRVIIPAEVHTDRLDQIETIAKIITDDVTAIVGRAPVMSTMIISATMRTWNGKASRTVLAVWFLPSRPAGVDGERNHGFDLEIDYAGSTAGVKITSWGTGHAADARLSFPDYRDTDADGMARFWARVDRVTRAILPPAFGQG
jgi:hypothetical protein